jgi:hypothetical protein
MTLIISAFVGALLIFIVLPAVSAWYGDGDDDDGDARHGYDDAEDEIDDLVDDLNVSNQLGYAYDRKQDALIQDNKAKIDTIDAAVAQLQSDSSSRGSASAAIVAPVVSALSVSGQAPQTLTVSWSATPARTTARVVLEPSSAAAPLSFPTGLSLFGATSLPTGTYSATAAAGATSVTFSSLPAGTASYKASVVAKHPDANIYSAVATAEGTTAEEFSQGGVSGMAESFGDDAVLAMAPLS